MFSPNTQIKASINEFETLYKPNEILGWFGRHRHQFPYHILISDALRSHNQEILSLTRFLLNDLTRQMKLARKGPSHNEVYLCTKLPTNLVDQIEQQKKNKCYCISALSFRNAIKSHCSI